MIVYLLAVIGLFTLLRWTRQAVKTAEERRQAPAKRMQLRRKAGMYDSHQRRKSATGAV